jgi:hypothetical protein
MREKTLTDGDLGRFSPPAYCPKMGIPTLRISKKRQNHGFPCNAHCFIFGQNNGGMMDFPPMITYNGEHEEGAYEEEHPAGQLLPGQGGG